MPEARRGRVSAAISRRNCYFAKVAEIPPSNAAADEAVSRMKWLAKTIRGERRALERARWRFVRKPSEKNLHDVRTTGRRFRSLLEDVAELAALERLRRRVKRAAAATDAARDATIILAPARKQHRTGEAADSAAAARAIAETQERLATQQARKELRRMHFAPLSST